jgi:hypothetical protein
VTLTVFFGHVRVRNPRCVLRGIEYVPNYRPRWRTRWIRQPSSSSTVAESSKDVKEKRDRKAVKGIDEKELHDGTGCLQKYNERLYIYLPSASECVLLPHGPEILPIQVVLVTPSEVRTELIRCSGVETSKMKSELAKLGSLHKAKKHSE